MGTQEILKLGIREQHRYIYQNFIYKKSVYRSQTDYILWIRNEFFVFTTKVIPSSRRASVAQESL
jgi:hypothetical protein